MNKRVTIIGGGVIGCSIAYHLTRLGWRDVLLLEKSELTSGSTWHAASNGNTFHTNPAFSRIYKMTYDLWASLPAETGQETSFHQVGGINLATTPQRMDEFKAIYGIGKRLGYGYQLLNPKEVVARCPIVHPDGLLGGLYDPKGGHADPYGITHAYAKGARSRGAEFRLRTPVTDLAPQRDGSWQVITDGEVIETEIIVNASGFYANEIAGMTNARLPMMAMQHQYIITDRIEALASIDHELPVFRDVDGSCYLRQESDGLLIGIYEADSHTFGEDAVPPDFDMALLPDDLDRLLPFYERIVQRVPCLADAGIKRIVNGPFCFTPDTRPLLGWMPEQRNHFAAAGFLAGLAMGGGFGQLIAEWIVEGQPSMDLTNCDVARFGDWALGEYTRARAHDSYARRYAVHLPHEERDAGRPVRTGPLYPRQRANRAVFGSVFGWERPLWFAPAGIEPKDTAGYRRPNWFATVGEECRALRGNVALVDLLGFSNYEVCGPGAENFVNRLFVNRAPNRVGQIKLMPMVNNVGGILGEFTVTRITDDVFYLAGSGAMQNLHRRWFEAHRPARGVEIRYLSEEMAGLSLAGPRSRELLSRLTDEDLSNDSYPFFNSREIVVGGVEIRALRVSFSGDLGYELHCRLPDQLRLYDAIRQVGKDLDLREIGTRAMDSLRLEKSYLRSGAEISSDVTPFELGLSSRVKLDKGEFIGREALLRHAESGPQRRLVTLAVEVSDADALGNESVFRGNTCVGAVTSGGYGHWTEQSLALALVDPKSAEVGTELSVMILANHQPATVIAPSPFDPMGQRLRN